MGIFSNNIKPILQRKDILIQLIVINVCIFLFLIITNVTRLFEVNITVPILDYIATTSALGKLAARFWTPLTYMFVHANFLHLLFNMLILYWFGRIFLSFFSSKNLGSLYILGGLAGAALFVLAFNTIPLFAKMNSNLMWGASASVMAIVFAAAFYKPNTEIGLLFIGRIKIIYIALVIFVLDLIGIVGPIDEPEKIAFLRNQGGHITHIGGAIIGYIYAKQYQKGRDITRWLNKLIDSVVNIFKPKPKNRMKVKFNKRDTDYDYNQRQKNETEAIDRILDKIKASGYTSLSADEKKRLFDASNK